MNITNYLELLRKRPELAAKVSAYPICLNEAELRAFQDKLGRRVGIIESNVPYWLVLADVIMPLGEQAFVYERIVPYKNKCAGTVILPRWTNNDTQEQLYGLLSISRHAIRQENCWELPRGHMSEDSEVTNGIKELEEEMGVDPSSITSIEYLGSSYTDTGLTSGKVTFILVDFSSARPPDGTKGHEGIQQAFWVTLKQMKELIRTQKIVDGMTHNCLLHYLLR